MTTVETDRKLLNALPDEVFTKPTMELTAFESDVLRHLLGGPCGEEVLERVDRLSKA